MAGDRLICLVSKTALTRTVLSLVIFVILTFLAIEVKRILDLNTSYLRQFEAVYMTTSLPPKSTTSPKVETIRRRNKSESAMEMKEPLCDRNLLFLVLVVSAPANFERRQAIRESWNDLSGVYGQVKVIFLIGKANNSFLNAMVSNEFENFGDVLIGSYTDTYRNLTTKVLHGFKWARGSCSSRFVLKTDDDCFVNLPFLVRFLENTDDRRGVYVGKIRRKAKVVRNRNSRWYVSKIDHDSPCYAQYASGAGYLLSRDVLVKLVDASADVAPFPNEDAYVGEVLYRARVRPINSGRFVSSGGNVWSWKPCNYSYMFVIHPVKPYEQKKLQKYVENALIQCQPTDELESWI